MSRLDELIAELCPDGVEYKSIGQICQSLKKETIKQDLLIDNGTYPVVNSGRSYYGYLDRYNNDGNAITIASRGEYAGWILYHATCFMAGGLCYPYRSMDESLYLTKFIYYALKNQEAYIRHVLVAEGSIPALNKQDIEKFTIPVPPLPVQHEIVRILDSFTELTAELTAELAAELAARKKQYQYYSRLQIEMIKKKYPTKPISAFGKWSGGKTPSMAEKRFWEAGTIPWISAKDMKASVLRDTEDHIAECAIKDASMKLYPKDCIAIVTRSGILKHSFPVSFIPFETTINQDIKILVPKSDVIPKYIFLALKAYAEDIRKKAKKQGGTVDSLEFHKFLEFELPYPPIEEQYRIAMILERFDALCNDIINGLPAEIIARQKQYEYYRDKLLTFKQAEVVQ